MLLKNKKNIGERECHLLTNVIEQGLKIFFPYTLKFNVNFVARYTLN